MENKVVAINENGNKVEIEVFLSFEVEELNKKYVAYTINDDKKNEEVPVFISEYEGNKLKSIPTSESKLVMECYNEAKNLIEE